MQASQVHPHQTLSSCLYGPALCTGAVMLKQEGTIPKLSNISWYADTFRVPFTGTKRPGAAPEEQPHTIIPLHQTLHLAQCSQTSTVLLANTRAGLVHQIARWRRAIRHSRERLYSSQVQWRRTLHHCIQRFALHLLMYGLDAAAWPWKPIP